jgi:hypothetical protein
VGLALNDVPLTVRRVAGQMNVYPRLLRDSSMLPRIALAIDYFESLLGHERQQIEHEMLVELFGDPRLARGITAALGHSYRFRTRRMDEVVGRGGAAHLKRAGLASSPSLRLWLYDRLNDTHAGFLPTTLRPQVWSRLEAQLKLRDGQLEPALYLDRPEHLRLERVGGPPRPADVAARYNFQVLECLLRHAEQVDLVLNHPTAEQGQAIVGWCGADGVHVALDRPTERVSFLGRQDALGGWGRHGRHLARGVLELLDRAGGLVRESQAQVSTRGRRARLRLTPEVLGILGGGGGGSEWEADDLPRILRACSATLRGWGWRVRMRPEPYVCSQGVVLPDLLVHRTHETAGCLVVAVRGPQHARRLARIAPGASAGEQLVYAGREADVAELRTVGAPVLGIAAGADALPAPSHLARLLHDELFVEATRAA